MVLLSMARKTAHVVFSIRFDSFALQGSLYTPPGQQMSGTNGSRMGMIGAGLKNLQVTLSRTAKRLFCISLHDEVAPSVIQPHKRERFQHRNNPAYIPCIQRNEI